MRLLRASGCLVAVLTVLGLASCTGDAQPEADRPPIIMPGAPGEPAKTLPPGERPSVPVTPPNEADVAFVNGMIVHHQQALDMTALVPDRAQDAKVKGVASRIADTQRPEIEAMKAWLKLHGHGEHGGHDEKTPMPGMATAAQLEALRAASGAAFDGLFLQLMITHHQGAVTMSHEIQNRGVDLRVQEIADDVVAVQSAEINRMRGMVRQ